MPRSSIVFGAGPRTTNPAISSCASPSTTPRVEYFPCDRCWRIQVGRRILLRQRGRTIPAPQRRSRHKSRDADGASLVSMGRRRSERKDVAQVIAAMNGATAF